MNRFWLAAHMLVLGFAGTAFAAPFQNGSFEGTSTNQFFVPAGSTLIPGWTVSVGNIDWEGPPPNGWQPSNGNASIDLVGGGAGGIGGIRQTFDTFAGASYQLLFDLAGNYGHLPVIKPLAVIVNGVTTPFSFDTTGRGPANMGWTTKTINFVANSGSSTIEFRSDVSASGGPLDAGAAIDNVRVTLVPASTTTTLGTSGTPVTVGTSVTLTATVSGVNHPTGTVQFTDGGSTIAGCSAPVLLTGTGPTKTATCTTSNFSVGSHSIVAFYGGDTYNFSSQNALTQVVDPLVVGATPWVVGPVNVVNGSTFQSIGSLPSVISDGTGGANAVFTYATINDYCCHTGDWTFQTTAPASGIARLNWTYSGYHGTCEAQASLTAFIERNGSIISTIPVFSAAEPSPCDGTYPNGGFGVNGQTVFGQAPFPALQVGDVYGFKMHSYNYDSNGGVQGRLTLSTGAQPTTTTVEASDNPLVYGESVKLTATVAGNAPTGTVTFTQEGRIMFGCDAVPMFGGSAECWTILPPSSTVVPPGPRNIVALYTGDTVNAGSVSSALLETVNAGSPASFSVDSDEDADDANPGNGTCAAVDSCTLRAAIQEASALARAVTITVRPGTYVLSLGPIDISGNVTINGAGAGSTIVDGGGIDRVFIVSSGVVVISGLTVTNGLTNGSEGSGGGIQNFGSLTLSQVDVSGNTSSADGGGIFSYQGTLVLDRSTVSGNEGGGGGGIFSLNGALTLTNTTVSGNHSIGISNCSSGGGGLLISAGQASITNSTVYANDADCTAGGGAAGLGHAISSQNGATVTIRNSILASSITGGEVCYGPVTSLGYNLFGDTTCSQVDTDQMFPNPQLLALGNYGAPTPTHELNPGSPARDAVPVANCATALDQWGITAALPDSHGFYFRRPQGPACDIGSVESAPLPTQYPTNTTLANVPSTTNVNDSVTFTATVTTTVLNNNLSGTVDFLIGDSPICPTATLTGSGDSKTATCTTSSLLVGSWLVTARYYGNSFNLLSEGQATQVVNAPPPPPLSPTTTTLVGAPNPSTVGADVNLTATVTKSGVGPNPTGTVDFINGVTPLCTALPLPASGPAICMTSSLPEGSWLITALYSGDTYNQASSGQVTQVVNIPAPAFAAPTLIRAAPPPNDSTKAYLIGRVDGAPNTPVTFNAYSAQSCDGGSLVGGSFVGSYTVVTDDSGYFGKLIPVNSGDPPVNSGDFVAIQLTAPGTSSMSACTVNTGDNDSWPKALNVVGSPRDYIDAAGKARWYKFSVLPGQKIQVTLSPKPPASVLPADYDLAVFKDIGKAFIDQLPTGADGITALNKLSAEFAPSTFSPSTFSPSTFSPSTFSPDAYSPSTFSNTDSFSSSLYSPSTFSPSTFSPSTFSPSTFSPSTFSPSTFSPSTFSPSTFSPSTFSPSTFSPSTFSQDEISRAFSSAQTRSIIGVSATPGTGNESVSVNTWNDTGDFYVRVAGKGGAFSTSGQFTLTVNKSATTCGNVSAGLAGSHPAVLGPPAELGLSGWQTIILTDSTLVPGNSAALLDKLASLAGNTGVVVDLKNDTRVVAYRTQANAHADCPYAMNLLAQQIKEVVDLYRAANSGLRYVVIAGNDRVVPFFRYPDESLLGQESAFVPPVKSDSTSEASLRQDFVLGQDAYGSSTSISMRGIDFPIPGLAVGRLVETADEIGRVIDAFLASGTVVPTSSLVTGYDFLADAAAAVSSELGAGIGSAPQSLVTANGVSPQHSSSWTATQLRSALFSARHDVIFLAGHFSANSALAADFSTSVLTTELAASTQNFTNSIVFSAGCHAGYNIVNADAIDGVTLQLDWPQAFAQKGATLIAGTGYQYGDTEFVEYSERLYANFARQLRAATPGGTAVSVGEALVKAKLDYLAATPEIRGIHQKALLEATVFGLPMLGIDMPHRLPNPSTSTIDPVPVSPGPGTVPAFASTLGLQTYPLDLSPPLGESYLCLRNPPYDTVIGPPGTNCSSTPANLYTKATWLTGPAPANLTASNPGEPVLPLQIINVTPSNNVVLRGVGFIGGSYEDSEVVPLTGAPTTELRGVHTPFLSPVFYPMRLWTPNYYGALSAGGGTKLLVTPVQHRAANVAAGTSTRRAFTGLNLRLYYSGNTSAPALSAAPTIVNVNAISDSAGVTFTAQVVGDPAAAIHDVWVTYTGEGGASGAWSSLTLAQCAPTPPATTPPAICGAIADPQKWMGHLAPQSATLKYIVQAVNGVGLVSLDDNLGAYYSVAAAGSGPLTAPVATALAFESSPSSGTYGGSSAITAKLTTSSGPVPGKAVTISVGSSSQTGVTGSNGSVTVDLPISSLPGTYLLKASFSGDHDFLPSSFSQNGFTVDKGTSHLDALSLGAMLTGSVAGDLQPIDGSVRFLLTSPTRGDVMVWAIVDYLGRATLPPPGLAAGNYTVTAAAFDGNAAYNRTRIALSQSIIIPAAAQTITFVAPPNKTFGDPDFTVSATASSALPVSFSAGPSTACTVTGATVHITGAGNCTITASQPGNLDYNAAAPVPRTFAIAQAGTTTSLVANPTSTVIGQPIALTATVVATPAAAGIPAGTLVTFKDGATLLGAPVVVTGGTASLTTSALSVGSHVLTATYGGNTNVASSTGTANVTVGLIPTTTALTADKTSPVAFGTTINLTATMSPTAATGTVTFFDGATTLGTATAVVGGSPAAPRATFAVSSLTVGSHSLTAVFAGNATTAGSTSVPLNLVVKASFTATNPMLQPRVSHTATLLNDGRVLVAGGSGSGDDDKRASRTAEIYCPNPYTPPSTPGLTLAQWCPNGLGKFSPAGRGNTTQVGLGNLVQARTYHTATLLPNGTVLLVGGFDGSGASTATAELYDPTNPIADKFAALPNLPGNAAAGHSATLITKTVSGVQKQYVLVIGGGSAKSWLYDVAAKTWSTSGSMPTVRSLHTASVAGAKVFVAGGTDASSRTLQTTAVYDIAAGTFANGPTMFAPRELHSATAIANGRILLAGGRMSTGFVTNSVALTPLAEVYNPATPATPFAASTFASGTGRFGHAATPLITAATGVPDGRVLVSGGATNVLCGSQLSTSELYGSGAFAAGEPMAVKRVRHAATVLKDGRVLITGGRGAVGNNCGPLSSAEIWTGPLGP